VCERVPTDNGFQQARRFQPNPEKFWGPGNLNKSNHLRIDQHSGSIKSKADAIRKRRRETEDSKLAKAKLEQ